MPKIRPAAPSGLLHKSYELSLALKALLGLTQVGSALALYLTPSDGIIRFVTWLSSQELSEDPADALALRLLHAAQHLSIDTITFYVLYLGAHGALNLGVVGLLWARLIWAYPLSIVVLLGFVIYQLYEFTVTGSPTMVALSLFDLIIVFLVWREYRAIRMKAGA